VREEDAGPRAEYLAFHSDHVHEAMRTGKAFIAGTAQPHISVANRLTVSRFRSLMSTAAGQKFLNENLHRTAVLASHIPTIANQRSGGLGGSNDARAISGQLSGGDALRGVPPPPTSHPLYVRLRAAVADWEVPREQQHDFLILSPALDPEAVWNEDEDSLEALQPRGTPGASSARPEQLSKLSPGLVGDVMEHLLREVVAEDSLGDILDRMLVEDSPHFLQLEDSAPPGHPEAPAAAQAAEPPVAAAAADAALLELLQAGDPKLGDWRSDLLADFPAPGPGRAASSDEAPPPEAAAGATEEAPQARWEDALREYGEVDLEAFKSAGGDVLDRMLLDMMDDVIAGRLNWMRPLPRMRPRR